MQLLAAGCVYSHNNPKWWNSLWMQENELRTRALISVETNRPPTQEWAEGLSTTTTGLHKWSLCREFLPFFWVFCPCTRSKRQTNWCRKTHMFHKCVAVVFTKLIFPWNLDKLSVSNWIGQQSVCQTVEGTTNAFKLWKITLCGHN